MLAILAEAKRRYGDLPVALAGFSFGAYVQTRVAQALAEANHPAQRLVLVGTAAGHVEGARQYAAKAVAHDTIVIHGSVDQTVPLANVLAWAEPLDLPVIVVPGADHFFHRRLHLIRDIVTRAWRH
jgi:alpha/beta superfamily hydrolase